MRTNNLFFAIFTIFTIYAGAIFAEDAVMGRPGSTSLLWNQLERALHKPLSIERAKNRTSAQYKWDYETPFRFPCEEQIKKYKQTHKALPGIYLMGEVHDAPFCVERRTVLTELAKKNHIWLGIESGSSYEQYRLTKSSPKHYRGLEEPHLKGVVALTLAYDYISRTKIKRASEEEYGGYDNLLTAFAIPEVAETLEAIVKKNNYAFIDFSSPKYKELIPYLTHLPEGAKLVTDGGKKITETLKEYSKDPNVILPLLKALSLELTHKTPDSVKPPGFDLEINLAMSDIDKWIQNPKDGKARTSFKEWRDYVLIAQRDRAMADAAARHYCDMLEHNQDPKQDTYFMIVGNDHVPGIIRQMNDELNKHDIPSGSEDGGRLAEFSDQLMGRDPNKPTDIWTTPFTDQPTYLEKAKGIPLGITKQMHGARIIIPFVKLDKLNLKSYLNSSLYVTGPIDKLYESIGVPKGASPTADQWTRLKNQMEEEYLLHYRIDDPRAPNKIPVSKD